MTEFKEPTRLHTLTERMENGPDAAASDSLRQALHALGATGPDAASMQRMREGLSTGMAGGGSFAPSASPVAGTFSRFAWLANTKGWLSLLVLTAASAMVWRSFGSESEHPRPIAAASVVEKHSAIEEASASDAPPPPSAAEDEEPAPKRRVRVDAAKRQAVPRPRVARIRSNERASEEIAARAEVASAAPETPVESVEIEIDVAPTKPEHAAVAETQAPTPRAVAAAVQPAPSNERNAPLDEPSLLQLARKRSNVEPEEALQLLAQHARRFPKGSLVQEREVLAVQVLRELGRTAEANARLAAFARKFPDSVYLSQLR